MVMPLAKRGHKRRAPKFGTAHGRLRGWRLVTQLVVAAAVVLVPLSAAAVMAAAQLRMASVEARTRPSTWPTSTT